MINGVVESRQDMKYPIRRKQEKFERFDLQICGGEGSIMGVYATAKRKTICQWQSLISWWLLGVADFAVADLFRFQNN